MQALGLLEPLAQLLDFMFFRGPLNILKVGRSDLKNSSSLMAQKERWIIILIKSIQQSQRDLHACKTEVPLAFQTGGGKYQEVSKTMKNCEQ